MSGRLRDTLLAAAIAAVLAGCGSDEDGTIPQPESENLLAQLGAVEASIAQGACDEATLRAEDLGDVVDALPADVGVETKEALRGAATNLVELTAQQCQPTGATGGTGVQPTTTETTEPATTTTTTTTEDTTDEGDDEKPPSDEGQPPSDEGQQPPDEQQPPSDEGGGEPPSGGLGPGGGEGR